jgi:hypothetical protein
MKLSTLFNKRSYHFSVSNLQKLKKFQVVMAMERIFFIYLIEALGLQKSVLHPEDSPIHHEFPADCVDRKIGDGVIWDLVDKIINHGLSYQDAKDFLERKLSAIPFIKDVLILNNKLHYILPLTMLKSLRHEIIFYRMDSEIIEILEWRYDEVHKIDARSSPRLQKYITSHNRFAKNLMWLQSFFCFHQKDI